MKRRYLLPAVLVLAVLVLSIVGVTTAYLTDAEVMDNVITIGKVEVTLVENFPETPPTVVPGSKQVKNPKLENTGTEDEIVFLRVTVPKSEVTLLYEEKVIEVGPPEVTHLKGTPRTAKAPKELFRLLAEASTDKVPANVFAADPADPPDPDLDIDFAYHKGDTVADEALCTAGWILLPDQCVMGADTDPDVYVFGYNRVLRTEAPNNETRTLFDQVQLKSFIDGEVKGVVSIGVTGIGIQVKNLKYTGTENLDAKTYLTQDELSAVYTIVKNKQGS